MKNHAADSLRPEEQAELRRTDITFEDGVVVLRISRAALELTTGRRTVGGPKSRAGKRIVVLPGFLTVDIRRHLDWFAAEEPDGLLFVGERGAPFRRSTFGRRWRKARAAVGLSPNFRFYDLGTSVSAGECSWGHNRPCGWRWRRWRSR
jgi:hypothetical protein